MSIERTIYIDPNPQELAKSFAEMNGDQQAEFFSALAAEVKEWSNPFCIQLQWITDSAALTEEARTLMEQIGEYARPLEAAQGEVKS